MDSLHELIESLNDEERDLVRRFILRLRAGEIDYSGLRNSLYTGEFPDLIGGFWPKDGV
ncbi:MAG: hypothetical protein K6T63_04800 [Alicyclobacillus herbarius]|uniref:hypothetical protein n=1 Tax=Alicyclobacillus herbarius TaxID=122960 RepID=UPI000416A726|nr:hypothetical protein [Alicyclobacillus herbarius]MCL6631934.1 hypothetical protein [Alicyclobacillus herbarius]